MKALLVCPLALLALPDGTPAWRTQSTTANTLDSLGRGATVADIRTVRQAPREAVDLLMRR